MQIYSQLTPLALNGAAGSAVAMGYFDGIHRGHRAVIQGAVQWAQAHGACPALFTFKLPSGSRMKGKRLLSTQDKHALVQSLGVQHYLCPEFAAIQSLPPEKFVQGIVEDCQARALFCGENFTFGAKAAGDPELLQALCRPLGVEVVVVPMAQYEDKPISSTRIRTALEGGDIPAANAMLGMPLCHPLSGGARGRLGPHPGGAHHQPDLPGGLSAAAVRHLHYPHACERGVVSFGYGSGDAAYREQRRNKGDLRDLYSRFQRGPLRYRAGRGVPCISVPQQKV